MSNEIPEAYKNLPSPNKIREIVEDELPNDPPDWFFLATAPLTLEPWIIYESERITTVQFGNSGLSILCGENDGETLTQHFMPNMELNNKHLNSFDYMALYLISLKQFVEWWDKLPADNSFKLRTILSGSTNDEMYNFREKMFNMMGEDIIKEGYRDTYDNNLDYFIKIPKLIGAFEGVNNPVYQRIFKNAQNIEGRLEMLNPLLRGYLEEAGYYN